MSVSRRNFLKGLAVGGTAGYFAMAGVTSTVMKDMFLPNEPVGDDDIGEIKSVKVTQISETSWFNNSILVNDMMKAGGLLVNQYIIPWTHEGVKEGYNGDNSGGYSALLDIEFLDGSKKKVLFDCGWNAAWMDECYKREGVDKMLANHEVDMLFQTHEHFDHCWGADAIVEVKNVKTPKYATLTKDELAFINELKKDEFYYDMLLRDYKRGIEIIKKKL